MKSNLIIHFHSSTDLKQWKVGPPYLRNFRLRKVATAHVLNSGDKALDGCVAFLEIIESDVSVSPQRQMPLHWADTPYDALSSSMTRVIISPSTEHRLDIVFTEECQGTIPGCSIASAQTLATGVQEDQFYLKPGKYLVRITVVSDSGDKAQKNFIIQSPDRWKDLNMQSVTENFLNKLLKKWHSLNMTAPVKVAVIGFIGTILAAVIAGIFLLIDTIVGCSFSKTELRGGTPPLRVVSNADSAQQQKAETIISSPTTMTSSKVVGEVKGDYVGRDKIVNNNYESNIKTMPDVTSLLSVSKIRESIQKSPPLQRAEVRNSFKGIKVIWDGYLESADKKYNNIVSIYLSPDDPNLKSGLMLICCEVSLKDYRELGILPEGTKIRVQGEIAAADILKIELTNVKLYFLNDKKSTPS